MAFGMLSVSFLEDGLPSRPETGVGWLVAIGASIARERGVKWPGTARLFFVDSHGQFPYRIQLSEVRKVCNLCAGPAEGNSAVTPKMASGG